MERTAAPSSSPSPPEPTEFWLDTVHVRVPERRVGASGRYQLLEPKVMRVLLCMAARPGEVVSRQELLDAVWPRAVVADDVLSRCVYRLRRALGDEPEQPRFIETIPKLGYRLLVAPSAMAPERTADPSAPGRRQRSGLVAGSALAVMMLAAGLFQLWREPAAPAVAPPLVTLLPIAPGSDGPELATLAFAFNDRLRSAVAEYAHQDGDVTLQWQPDSDRAVLDRAGPQYAFHGILQTNPGENRALLHLHIDSLSGGRTVTSPLNVFEIPYPGTDLAAVDGYREAVVQRILYYLTVELPYVHHNLDELELEAFRLLMYADWELYSGRDCGIGAHSLLERAVELNPASPRAWAQLGEAYWTQVWDCGRGRAFVDKSRQALDTALSIEADHIAGVYLRAIVDAETGNPESAYAELEPHLRAAPNETYLRYARMELLVYAGFLDEATAELDAIEAGDPLALSAELVEVPMSLFHSGRYRRFLALAPTKPIAVMYYYRALAHVFLGEHERARVLLERQRRLAASSVFADYSRALEGYLDGDYGTVVAMVDAVASRRGSAPVDAAAAFREAELLALAGEADAAAARVEQAVAGGFVCPPCYRNGPGFALLRGHPRFDLAMEAARRRHLDFARRFELAPEATAVAGEAGDAGAPAGR